MKKQNKGFTLVELLVVSGILGILMGALFPAVSGAMLSAKTAACAAVLSRQGTYYSLECVSKSWKMQFRANQVAVQGDFPQACWRQVKGNQRRNAA